MNSAYLILGGNLGNKRKNLALALGMIRAGIGNILRGSNIYETEPWGLKNVKTFFNQVIEINTFLTPLELLEKKNKIESSFGRRRDQHNRYQSRRMDIDILFYDKEVINMPELTIPHPRLHERNFVLMPLCELAAELIHPVLNKTIRQLKAECKDVKWTRIVPE